MTLSTVQDHCTYLGLNLWILGFASIDWLSS